MIIKIASKNENQSFLLNSSKIRLKIKGPGNQKIYFRYKPDEIYINGNKQYAIQNSYTFDLLDNLVELIYNNNLEDCSYMFQNCQGISEIDLSNFNSSLVTNMKCIFYGCINLHKADLSNLNTSNVKNLQGIFYKCSSLTSVDLSNFDTSKVYNIGHMFYDCWSLEKINFSNWNTKNVQEMSSIFYNCSSLTSLNLSNWETNNVQYFNCTFYNCSSLTSLNISHFYTPKVLNINGMFNNCSLLISLDLSNFDLSKTTMMQYMFYNCISLVSLDLSNFNTSLIIDMGYVFYNCWSLTSLNLSGWNTKTATSMAFMFYNCSSLNVLNLSSFDGSKVTHFDSIFYNLTSIEYINLHNFRINKYNYKHDYEKLFYGAADNLVVCMNDESYNFPNNYIVNGLKYKKCLIRDCSNNWKLKQKKVVIDNNRITCVDKCNSNSKYKYEYFGQCSENCKNGVDDDLIKCKCELEKCFSCSKASLKKKLCTKCNYDYYPIENDFSNIGIYIDCHKDPEGYYLDKKDSIYKKCYETCKTCQINGDYINHNCLKCDSQYIFELNKNNYYINCYKKCNSYYYFDGDNNYHCTDDYICPKEYNKIIKEKKKCVKKCDNDDTYKYEFNNRCYRENMYPSIELRNSYSSLEINNIYTKIEEQEIIIDCGNINAEEYCKNCDINHLRSILCFSKNNSKENNKVSNIQDDILKDLEMVLSSKQYKTYNLDIGKEEIIKYENLTITFTTLQNQKNNIFNTSINRTIIDLGKYEMLLRKYHNISDDKTIYLKKIEVMEEGMRIPKIEFELYYKSKEGNLVKLKKNIDENMRVDIFIPIEIKENYDTLNISSGYFNDICYKTTSEFGTDITLEDRIVDFIDKNKTICQEDCYFSNYDENIKLVGCSCKIKDDSPLSIFELKINKTKLYYNFKHITNIININIIICYEKLFKKNSILYNIGFYIFIPIIVLNIISIFIFFKKQLFHINNIIKDITFAIKNSNLIQKDKKELNNNKNYIPKDRKNKSDNKSNMVKDKNDKSINIAPVSKGIILQKKRKNIRKKKNKQKNNPLININNKSISNNIITKNTDNKGTNIIFNSQIEKLKKIEKIKRIMEYNDDEINKLPYDLAIQYDNRTYCQYYISLLKTKHNLIFSFFNKTDYNSRIIKIDLFFISFTIFYTINTLFYNDNTIHNIYINKGSFDIEYHFPIIIYSSIISIVINILFKLLALTNDAIIRFKQSKSKDNIEERENVLNKKLKIKFIIFFVTSFIFMLFCWLYMAVFCSIYKNSQIHLIKNISISFGLSLVYPFIIYIFPGIFRIKALSKGKNKRKCLYTFSQILQMI